LILSLCAIMAGAVTARADNDEIEAAKARCVKVTLKDQGLEREAWLYVPEKQVNTESSSAAAAAANAASVSAVATASDTPLPLVMVLHGYGGTALNGGRRFFDLADRFGFAVCWPQGAKDGKGKNCWNVGYPVQEGYKIDDEKFICRLVRKLQKEYGLSRKNVFLTGMSNGGEMCYMMAADHPETFSAIASIAGLTLTCMKAEYTEPVPFMEVHGTADRTSEWGGDPDNEGGWGAYFNVPLAVGRIVAANRCLTETVTRVPSYTGEVLLHSYGRGLPAWEGGPSADVLLYEVKDGPHSWSEKYIPTCDLVWDFFAKYLR
jgi:polyhydroxybutyrate depolymerase